MKRLALVSLLIVAVGCSPPPQPLRVGLVDWPPYEFARLAQELDYFGELEIELVDFTTSAEMLRAYAVGGLDIAPMTFDDLLALSAGEAAHRVIFVINESIGGDAVISREPLEDLSGIAGMRIGLESSELGAHMLTRLLQNAGLTRDDIEITFYDLPDHQRAWETNEVDLLISWGPVVTHMVADGGHVVFSSAEIPGEIVDVFAARSADIDERDNAYQQFARGWFRALRFWQDNPNRTAEILAPRLGLSEQQFMDSLAGMHVFTLAENHAALGPKRDEFLAAISRFARTAARDESVDIPADLPALLTMRVLPALDEAGR